MTLSKTATLYYQPISLIFLLALLVRISWLITQPVVIENEGAQYARIAENLLAGKGYIGILGTPELIYPPLFPLLIATFSLFTEDFELAGRTVSLVMGTCIVLPIFFIALQLYGRTVAHLSALLAALHPLFIALSTSLYSEATFFTLLMLGISRSFHTLHPFPPRADILASLFFGLAFLTRPEAIAFPFIVLAALVGIGFYQGVSLRFLAAQSIKLVVPFALLIIPYSAFLYTHTGQLRIDRKTVFNSLVQDKMSRGASYLEAVFGIDANFSQQPPLFEQYLTAKSSIFNSSLREFTQQWLTTAKRNAKSIVHALLGVSPLGSPLLLWLVSFGLFRSAWTPQRALFEGILLLAVFYILLILLSVFDVWPRYVFPLLPFLLIWASYGIYELSRWTHDTTACLISSTLPIKKLVKVLTLVSVGVVLLFFSFRGVENLGEFEQSSRKYSVLKDAGHYLRNHALSSKRVMDVSSIISYYAAGIWLPFPYADSSLALEYIRYKNPDFIVLNERSIAQRPFLQEWLQGGIPAEEAQLIYRSQDIEQDTVLIYEWNTTRKGTMTQ